MEINGKSAYFIAAKALIRDGKNLLITHDIFGSWDIPGGRIKGDEFAKPLEEVLDRKLREELGANVQYQIGRPNTFFQVERNEAGIDQKVGIFAVGYEVSYLGGEIMLGEHHDEYRWVNINNFQPETLFEGGWLTGLQQYLNQD
jgi:8-oxo-dGTP pyrophosphatase MutT (NUDIX family)